MITYKNKTADFIFKMLVLCLFDNKKALLDAYPCFCGSRRSSAVRGVLLSGGDLLPGGRGHSPCEQNDTRL